MNPITERQVTKLIVLINRVGKSTYRRHKAALGIELDKPVPDLTKQEAWLLIDRIVNSKRERAR